MGLNYQLYKQWQLNASVNYQHHFINNNTTAGSNAVERGTAFQLALNYRF
jgi:long-subunit fatty acid transport protein